MIKTDGVQPHIFQLFHTSCLIIPQEAPTDHMTPPAAPHPVALQVSHLDLQQGQVPEDLQVVLVPLQSIPITLDGLFVLLVRALQKTVDVPACLTVKEHNH